ncbi:MAG: hypothetical protein R2699_08050 [Acidimicrobiales bacterium]
MRKATDVPTHSSGPPVQFQWTSSGASMASMRIVKRVAPSSKPKVAVPPSSGSAVASVVHHEAKPSAVVMAVKTASGGASIVSSWTMSCMAPMLGPASRGCVGVTLAISGRR